MRVRVGFVFAFVVLAFVVLSVAGPSRSFAAHHLWSFSEAFSNASGSTQFVELFCTDAGESALGSGPGGQPWTITSGGQTINLANLSTAVHDTANAHLLLATSNFAALPGAVPPDFIIPTGFLSTGGGTLNYASSTDVWAYGGLPTDGVHSLSRSGTTITTTVNSPTNYSTGAVGSISLAAAAVPGLPKAGIAVLVGMLLLAGSGLLRRRSSRTPATAE
jgi:hypothetical protein